MYFLVRTTELPLIWMFRMVPGLDLRVGLHRREGDGIWRVRRGGIRITVGEQRLECSAGQLVVIPPNTPEKQTVGVRVTRSGRVILASPARAAE
jgi:hypothetical protein